MGDDIQLTLNWVCFEMIGFLFVALAYGYSLTIMFILVEMKEKKAQHISDTNIAQHSNQFQ